MRSHKGIILELSNKLIKMRKSSNSEIVFAFKPGQDLQAHIPYQNIFIAQEFFEIIGVQYTPRGLDKFVGEKMQHKDP